MSVRLRRIESSLSSTYPSANCHSHYLARHLSLPNPCLCFVCLASLTWGTRMCRRPSILDPFNLQFYWQSRPSMVKHFQSLAIDYLTYPNLRNRRSLGMDFPHIALVDQ